MCIRPIHPDFPLTKYWCSLFCLCVYGQENGRPFPSNQYSSNELQRWGKEHTAWAAGPELLAEVPEVVQIFRRLELVQLQHLISLLRMHPRRRRRFVFIGTGLLQLPIASI